MILYVFIIIMLLPAAALAACSDPILLEFFDRVDANDDGILDVAEATVYAKKYDENGDNAVTFPEVKNRTPIVDPGLVGYEEKIFPTFDVNKDGVITAADVGAIFAAGDKDTDGKLTKAEYQAALSC